MIQNALGNGIVTTAFTYDIQNRLRKINDPANLGTKPFAMELQYNAPNVSSATAQFAGNISAVKWKQSGGSEQTYYYTYDIYSRMTSGIHSGSNNEQSIGYDSNGNVNALTRTGAQAAGLGYTYSGNRLTSLTKDGTPYSYAYDANGNTTTDGLRGMTLAYNYLNLPKTVTKGSDVLTYIYDAAGSKLAEKLNTTVNNFYTGVIVYKGDKTIDYIPASTGLIRKVGSDFVRQYNINDHLGNVRAVVNQSGTIEQANDYYPYGLAFSYNNLDKNRYLYNGKELQNQTLATTFFGVYDYGARMYDPALGRFYTQDRFFEKYFPLSPYQYAANNPIKYIDVNGDSLSVAEKYREQLDKTLATIFGNNAKNFSYTKTGMLVYSGTPKDFKGDTKKVYSQLSGTLSESTTTNVIYEETTQIALNDGTKNNIKAADGGGGLAVLIGENNVSQNTVLISPSAKTEFTVFAITSAYYVSPIDPSNGPRFNETKIQSNQTDLTFHELGHIINRGQSQDRVINFNNQVRKIMGLKPRPYDETHNRTVIQGNY